MPQISHKPNSCFVHLFKGGALRVAEPRGLSAKTALFLFAKLFLFGAILSKRKSDMGILVSIVSASEYSDIFPFTHFFFGTRAAKKKFPKRNGGCACAARRHYSWRAHF